MDEVKKKSVDICDWIRDKKYWFAMMGLYTGVAFAGWTIYYRGYNRGFNDAFATVKYVGTDILNIIE